MEEIRGDDGGEVGYPNPKLRIPPCGCARSIVCTRPHSNTRQNDSCEKHEYAKQVPQVQIPWHPKVVKFCAGIWRQTNHPFTAILAFSPTICYLQLTKGRLGTGGSRANSNGNSKETIKSRFRKAHFLEYHLPKAFSISANCRPHIIEIICRREIEASHKEEGCKHTAQHAYDVKRRAGYFSLIAYCLLPRRCN